MRYPYQFGLLGGGFPINDPRMVGQGQLPQPVASHCESSPWTDHRCSPMQVSDPIPPSGGLSPQNAQPQQAVPWDYLMHPTTRKGRY